MKKLILLIILLIAIILSGSWFIMNNSRIDKVETSQGFTEKYFWFDKLIAERNYTEGALNGLTRTYYPDGQLKGEWNFENGKMQGISHHYAKDGSLRYEDQYQDGKRLIRKSYDKDGKLIGVERAENS